LPFPCTPSDKGLNRFAFVVSTWHHAKDGVYCRKATGVFISNTLNV
jgi:hypothetical protein